MILMHGSMLKDGSDSSTGEARITQNFIKQPSIKPTDH